jgi:hypothetical protein
MRNLRPVAADALWIVSLQIAFAAVRAVDWWEDGPACERARHRAGDRP